MKFGVSSLLWVGQWSDSCIPILQKCRQLGFDSVEIPMFSLDFNANTLRAALLEEALGAVGCVALSPETDIASESAAVRSAGVSFIKQCIDKVHAFGGCGLGGPVTTAWCKNPKRSASRDEWRWAAASLHEIGMHAQDRGIDVCIEPLNRFETYFINTVQQAAELIELSKTPGLRILADTFHMNIEEKNPWRELFVHKDKIGYVHCAENDRGMLGTGRIDWAGLFKVLQVMGFNGTVAIETFVVDTPDLAGATSTWRRLAPSADTLAEEGLQFLKGVDSRTALAGVQAATTML